MPLARPYHWKMILSRVVISLFILTTVILAYVVVWNIDYVRAPQSSHTPIVPIQAARELLESQSIDKVRALLLHNGRSQETLLRVGSTKFTWVSSALSSDIIIDVRQVTAQKTSFVIAPTLVAGESPNLPSRPEVPMIFIFNDNGRLLHVFGDKDFESRGAALELIALTLGTDDSWFIWVERGTERGQRLGTPHAIRQLDVYLLGPELKQVLSMKHYEDNLTNCWTSKDSASHGSFIEANRTRTFKLTPGDTAEALDKTSQIPRLIWVPETQSFKGPSTMKLQGELLYEVDLKQSRGFQATDRPK